MMLCGISSSWCCCSHFVIMIIPSCERDVATNIKKCCSECSFALVSFEKEQDAVLCVVWIAVASEYSTTTRSTL